MHQVPSLHFRGALSLEQRKLKSSSPALSQALGQLCRWSNYRGTRGTPAGPDGAAGEGQDSLGTAEQRPGDTAQKQTYDRARQRGKLEVYILRHQQSF